MKRFHCFLMLVLLVMFSSCSSCSEDKNTIRGKKTTISVNMPADSTDNIRLLWEKGDTITLKCYLSEESDSCIASDFVLISGEGTTNGRFRGIVPDSCKWFTAAYKIPGSSNDPHHDVDNAAVVQKGFNSKEHIGRSVVLRSRNRRLSLDEISRDIDLTLGSYILSFDVHYLPREMKDIRKITLFIKKEGSYIRLCHLNVEGISRAMFNKKHNKLYVSSSRELYFSNPEGTDKKDCISLVLFIEGSDNSYSVYNVPKGGINFRHNNIYNYVVTDDNEGDDKMNNWELASFKGTPDVDQIWIKTLNDAVPTENLFKKDTEKLVLKSDKPIDGWYVYQLRDFGIITNIDEINDSIKEIMTDINLPVRISEIGICAFQDCKKLKNVKLNGKIQNINSFAFNGCSSIETINLPEGLLEIGSMTFSGCEALRSVRFPYTISYIGDYAFESCTNLKNVTIPWCVSRIGKSAFGYIAMDEFHLHTPANSINNLYDIFNPGDMMFCKLFLDESWRDSESVDVENHRWFGIEFGSIEFEENNDMEEWVKPTRYFRSGIH